MLCIVSQLLSRQKGNHTAALVGTGKDKKEMTVVSLTDASAGRSERL